MTDHHDSNNYQIIEQVIQGRQQRDQLLQENAQRQQEGWKVARNCAQILKEQFRVQKVVLFGSLLNVEEISPHSDIDLAVWGLAEQDIWKAGAAIEVGHDFVIDLVEVEKAKPHIQKAISRGVSL